MRLQEQDSGPQGETEYVSIWRTDLELTGQGPPQTSGSPSHPDCLDFRSFLFITEGAGCGSWLFRATADEDKENRGLAVPAPGGEAGRLLTEVVAAILGHGCVIPSTPELGVDILKRTTGFMFYICKFTLSFDLLWEHFPVYRFESVWQRSLPAPSMIAKPIELKEGAGRTQTQYRSEKQRHKEMELKVNNMEEEMQDLRTDKESLERTLSERKKKKKWQAERQRRDEEVEELRKSSQQELDNVWAQLRKARTSNDNAASEQLQTELEEEWKGKCEQAVAVAKEQHRREQSELTEQRDALQDKLNQLQEKFTALKQSKESEEQSLLQQRSHTEELNALQEKYTALEQQGTAVREKLERRVVELENKLAEQQGSGDTAAEVKRVMNGVFHSLRGEFDLSESYSGQAVLG
ncbi:FK506-binding protein 15-like [Sphaeramia orbicularis]|uniref:FK506-binding protein 15-like n=1 Tax=Sphaeramia orbicularis TaxID=375764 RepID=UPI00117D0EED|nr:FK506-binding protein 15-like [Sphaeramia orbicularis]